MKRVPHQHEAIIDKAASEYVEEHNKHIKVYQKIASNIVNLDVKGKKYLEIGAGPGLLATMIAKMKSDISIMALDTSPDMAKIANEVIESEGLSSRISYMVGNAADKDIFNGEKFDLVYSTFSLHHWENPERVFANMSKYLAKDGKMYVYDFNRVWWVYYLPKSMSEVTAIRAGYLSSEVKKMLRNIGIQKFNIKKVFPVFLEIKAENRN